MLVAALDVIWIYDQCIRPPGPKMVVCLEPSLGLFFRINTNPKWQTPIKLTKEPDHPFLDHDSYLECGEPIELDDFVIDESVRQRGVIGQISKKLAPAIFQAIAAATTVSQTDKDAIRGALGLAEKEEG